MIELIEQIADLCDEIPAEFEEVVGETLAEQARDELLGWIGKWRHCAECQEG